MFKPYLIFFFSIAFLLHEWWRNSHKILWYEPWSIQWKSNKIRWKNSTNWTLPHVNATSVYLWHLQCQMIDLCVAIRQPHILEMTFLIYAEYLAYKLTQHQNQAHYFFLCVEEASKSVFFLCKNWIFYYFILKKKIVAQNGWL